MDKKNILDLKGFSYVVDSEQIKAYRSWPMERRLRWLFLGNRMRHQLDPGTKAIQDEFRQAKR